MSTPISVNNMVLFQSIPLLNSLLKSPGLSVPTLYELNRVIAKVDEVVRLVAKMRDEIFTEHKREPTETETAPQPGQPPLLTLDGIQKVNELFQCDSPVDITPISVKKLDKLTTLRNPDGSETPITGETLQPIMWLLAE